jgi:hypothetical protein
LVVELPCHWTELLNMMVRVLGLNEVIEPLMFTTVVAADAGIGRTNSARSATTTAIRRLTASLLG